MIAVDFLVIFVIKTHLEKNVVAETKQEYHEPERLHYVLEAESYVNILSFWHYNEQEIVNHYERYHCEKAQTSFKTRLLFRLLNMTHAFKARMLDNNSTVGPNKVPDLAHSQKIFS